MFHVTFSPTITVASASDADLARATQEIATALETTIGAAPQQWYSFKPIWPPTAEEGAALETRARQMQAAATVVHQPVEQLPAADPA